MRFITSLLFFLLSASLHAETASTAAATARSAYQEPFSAGDVVQLLLGLGFVLGLILLLAWVVRRYSGLAPMVRHMKVLGVLPLGTREKAVLVDVAGKQMLLGVAPGRVTLLESFDNPIVDQSAGASTGFSAKLAEALQRRKDDA